MLRLSLILFVMIATTLMGIAVVAVLAMGMGTGGPILLAAAGGLVISVPVAWLVSRAILRGQKAP